MMKNMTKFYIFTILLYIHLRCCQSFFFQKQTTISSVQKAAQEKIKNIVVECMEKEKSNPLHVYALFAVHTQDLQAKCVLLCVMHNCNLMDEDGNYDKQKVEEIMRRTEPKQPSKFSFFGGNKNSDNNETLKECIDKDYRNNSCERAYIFTKCLQKQTKKSFNTLTGDLYNQASDDNNTLEIATTETSIITTLESISTAMETNLGNTVESRYNATTEITDMYEYYNTTMENGAVLNISRGEADTPIGTVFNGTGITTEAELINPNNMTTSTDEAQTSGNFMKL